MKREMRIINFITEDNVKLFDVETMRKILGVSRSKVQREIKRNNLSEILTYKNQNLYSQNTLFSLMETILIEKLNNDRLPENKNYSRKNRQE
jgi:hypothetical protein